MLFLYLVLNIFEGENFFFLTRSFNYTLIPFFCGREILIFISNTVNCFADLFGNIIDSDGGEIEKTKLILWLWNIWRNGVCRYDDVYDDDKYLPLFCIIFLMIFCVHVLGTFEDIKSENSSIFYGNNILYEKSKVSILSCNFVCL